MDLASLLAKLIDQPGGRLLKALVYSVALHLTLIMLVQPARQAGTVEVVLEARIVAVPTQPAALPPVATNTEADLHEPPAAEVPIPSDMASTPEPTPTQSARQPTESGSWTDAQAQPAQAGEIKTGEPGVAAAGPATGLPEIPVMLDTRWYTARQVDRRPEITTPVLPVYPEEARRRGIQGSVVIEVHIDETGRVRDIEVLEASPPGVFDAAVLDVYGKAEYSPAVLDGRPVRYIGKYRVLFELD